MKARPVGGVADWSYPLEGAVQETFAREARKCHCYIVVPTVPAGGSGYEAMFQRRHPF